MISSDKIAQATKELREWAKSPATADSNPTSPEVSVEDATMTLEIGGGGAVDYYAKNQKTMREEGKKSRPRGSSSFVMAVVRDAIEGGDGREGLARAYRRTKGYSESGEEDRRELYKQQYMEEQFLPVVEAVVNFTSPDELLNSPQALAELDQYVMGVGSGNGYTEGYIRAAYGDALGRQISASDPTVSQAVRGIRGLASNDQVRAAYGLAQKIKAEIDKGQRMASEEDYDLIARVAAYK